MSERLVSIVICTWNRVDMLVDSVRSVLECSSKPGWRIELLVVDNGSTDDTAAKMAPFADGGRLSYIYEPEPGLSNARNRAVREANGEWSIFLDDDILVEPNFIANYLDVFERSPEFSFWAAPVIPAFDVATPKWLSAVVERHPWTLSALDLGGGVRELSPQQTPFGANMAVRTDVARVVPFSTHLGFKRGSLVPGEETALFAEIRAKGYRGGWHPGSAVRHRMPAARSSVRYLTVRAFGQGRSDRRVEVMRKQSPRWVLKQLATSTLMLPVSALAGRDRSVPALLEISRCSGHVWETCVELGARR